MKLSLLREKLNHKYQLNLSPLTNEEKFCLDQIKVIGITGSKGKSTIAYLLHKYMEKLNISHQLYCSMSEGSNKDNINKNISVDIPLKSDRKILSILEELKNHPVMYLILEVSERAIYNQITDEIDFELKVLTNILTKHNKLEFNENDYVQLKLSFLKNSIYNIIGLTEDVTKEMIEVVTRQNEKKPIIYSTRFLAATKGVNENDIQYLLYDINQKLEGFSFHVLQNNNSYTYKTNLLLKHNALNLTCLIAMIDTLGIYNQIALYQMLKQIQILAREEAFQYDSKIILVGTSLIPVLEELKAMQQENIIKGNIIVVTGSPGLGFIKWKTNDYDLEERKASREFAMRYVKTYADKVYITESDSAATPFSEISTELVVLLNHEIPYVIEKERYRAIERAIVEAKENDIIYIAGRGNRALLYDQEKVSRYFNDLEVVKEIIKRGESNEHIEDN
jgi:UDP-N-acetylmuramoylalanyl-D-glutamate--2,6-diaminopimelate ligase